MLNKKGDIWISAVLYMLIAVAVVMLVLRAGVPQINMMRDRVLFSKAQQTMMLLNDEIQAVASEGYGSQRIVPIEIDSGVLKVENNRLVWQIKTKSKIIEPRTKLTLGNLIITSNADVSAKEYSSYYLLKNSIIEVNISKFNSPVNPGYIDTSSLISSMKYEENIIDGIFSFLINGEQETAIGEGYTYLLNEGVDLGFATVIAHIESDKFTYDLEITLESQADFISAKIKNLKVN